MVGIGAQDDFAYAESFVNDTGTTFTMLWSDSFASWNHFRITANSSVVLLDRAGERVGNRPGRFDAGRISDQLDSLG